MKSELDRVAPPLAREPIILGAGQTAFMGGKVRTKTLRDLAGEAAAEAMEAAGAKAEDIDLLIVPQAMGGIILNQANTSPLIAEHLGLVGIPSIRLENACASGSVGLHTALTAIEAGWADTVLVVGIEIMSGISTAMVQKVLSAGGDATYEVPVGATFPGLYAMFGTRIIHEQLGGDFKQGMEDLAYIALKNHHNAQYNKKAQFPFTIESLAQKRGVDDVWEFLNNPEFNPIISWPLRLFDCSPTTDGGAACVISAKDTAASYSGFAHGAQIIASAQSTGNMPQSLAPTLSSLPAARLAARAAYNRIGLADDPEAIRKRVSVVEVHDCFTSAEVLAIGDLNLFPRDETLAAAREGRTAIGGEIPVNTSGGLKAKGHPIAATGLAQIYTLFEQLNHEVAPEVQVNDIDLALAHNVGGTGGCACVNILQKV
ncbi:MAG TPA: beta-ketoacyl synthase N-terminal-like domain-containing protein [Candidatus Lokiarchaeia archaeon]|nr:beta-ketoacyl synthase N-terminal-like domain-containing protein [Candidatus Lokiarchaeia archaeon]